MSNAPRPSKNERRDAAREKAREQRLRQQRREKRNRAILQVSIGAVILAIVAVVAVVIVNSVRPPGPGPANMANGGITIEGAGLTAVRSSAQAVSATPTPQATATGGKVLIQAYEDFGCPICREFEEANGAYVQQLVKSGAAVVQYHPVAILDTHFTDNDYSSRAANAAAAIANYSPDTYAAFHALLYKSSVQPEEGSEGLSNDRLIALAKQAGASNMPQITKAIQDERFAAWVRARTDEFIENGGSLSAVKFPATRTAAGTPTIIVDGQFFAGDPTTNGPFGNFVTSVGGKLQSTPTPTPSPTASN